MTSKRVAANGTSTVVLLPIMAGIVGVYLVIGFAMPVLPLHVHQRLGFGPFVVGLVSGSQFAAAMISWPSGLPRSIHDLCQLRPWAATAIRNARRQRGVGGNRTQTVTSSKVKLGGVA